MSKIFHWVIQPILVIAIIGAGLYFANKFSLSENNPDQVERDVYAPLVRTIIAEPSSHTIELQGQGTLQAKIQLDLESAVSGTVIEVHPALHAGGNIKKGDTVVKLDPQEYQLEVIQNEAEVIAAQTTLELEIAESNSALAEWRDLNPNVKAPALVARQPQIDQARAEVNAAQARLEKAKLELRRTEIKMPFNGRVIETNISTGALISPNETIATLYDRDEFEIPVPLDIEELHWIELPNATTPGSHAKIQLKVGENEITLLGQVVRIESELNQRTRLARVIVNLDSNDIPAELKNTIIPGLFVSVTLYGREIDNIAILPKSVLRDGETLWTVLEDKLTSVEANILRRTGNRILVSGIQSGTKIITSNLDVATEGMQVRTVDTPG